MTKKCGQYFDTILLKTGKNYDYTLNGVFFQDLELDNREVIMDAVVEDPGDTMGTLSLIIPYFFEPPFRRRESLEAVYSTVFLTRASVALACPAMQRIMAFSFIAAGTAYRKRLM